MGLLFQASLAAILGILTTLTSICLLPMYPNFLFNLGKRYSDNPTKKTYFFFSTIVVLGVLTFMYTIGLLFVMLLQSPLSQLISVFLPMIFGLMLVAGIMMVLGNNVQKHLPKFDVPTVENSIVNAYAFGLVFGAVVLPCSPVFIAIFFAKSLLVTDPVNTTVNFMVFGLGIGLPLMAFSIMPISKSRKIVQLFANNHQKVNKASGAILVFISTYYLIFAINFL
jgi:cytochrome c-type biogenesis protein